jgi:hypothetical protein
MASVAPQKQDDEPIIDEIVEDRSKAAQGMIKRYRRGKFLGKVGLHCNLQTQAGLHSNTNRRS